MDNNFQRHSADGGLWTRFTNAISGGGIFRTFVRLIALLSALIILGLNKIQCSLNYTGNNVTGGFDKLIIFYEAMKYGYERASILLWTQLNNFTVESLNNWGDMLILGLFVMFVFFALYTFISIIADFFDGDVRDKAPMTIKLVITLAVMLVFSATLFYTTPKPSGPYSVNTGLILTNSEQITCKQTGELSYFTSIDSMKQNIIGGVNQTINNSINIINQTINNSQIILNNSNNITDKSVQLINMLNN